MKSLIGLDLNAKKTLLFHMQEGACVVTSPIYANPQATVGNMLNIFKKGSAHLAIVCEDSQKMVYEADLLNEAIKKGTDQQLSTSRHNVIGITTLEKIIEQILSMPILDEKDLDKKNRGQA